MSAIVRRFGSVTALDGASLELLPGEVHGVLGENGAGKTTLLNVLGGMLPADAGTVEIDGMPVRLATPRDAWRHGIGMVHQHFKLVSPLTVLENLALGYRVRGHGMRLPLEAVRRRVSALQERTGLRVELRRTVAELGVGARQRVEILKALLREPEVLVLDEPTAVLAPAETRALFELLRSLAAGGRAVALVAHKLDEVLAVADRVTVLRSGRTVHTARREETDADALVRAMVGDAAATSRAASGAAVGSARLAQLRPPMPGRVPDPSAPTATGSPPPADVVAALEGVSVRRRSGGRGDASSGLLAGESPPALQDVSLDVRRGEVVGIAGVEGNGQRELALVLAGRLAPDEGRARVPARTGFIPQDRTTEGLALDLDLTDNVALAFHDAPSSRGAGGWVGWMPWATLRVATADLIARYDVRATGPGDRARALSGGNQQKLVVGRELRVSGDLLVAENPTRGLDVGATRFVHEELRRFVGRRDGPAPGVVLISSDLDEVLALSTWLFVMAGGRLIEAPDERRSREGVGALMLGAAP